MSNPTFGMRVDDQPFDADELEPILTRQLGAADAAISLIQRGFCSADVDGSTISLTLLREGRCLVIEPRGEPGWTTMFQICHEYARESGMRLAMFDEEYTHCVCVDAESTVEQIHQTMEHDPFEAERVIKKLGT